MTINFALWDELLHRYVDQQGRVDYAAWKLESLPQLDQWLQTVAIDLPSYANLKQPDSNQPDVNQRLALWLNLYNALTIAQVLQHYPIASIQPKVFGIPNWIAFLWFFLRPNPVGNQRYSLNTIEHKILRPSFNEPRIHFALVCASIGCPLLRNEAYQPETVQAQLAADATRFIQNPAKVRYDRSTQTLYCSKIFKWYRQDFLKVAPSIAAYVQPYLPFELSDNPAIVYLNYDWSLNQRTSS